MSELIPVNTALPETDPDDPRIGRMLGTGLEDGKNPKAVIIGFPTDKGVRINNGRPGAASAPPYIRSYLYKMALPYASVDSFQGFISAVKDLGDLKIGDPEDLETSQSALGEIIADYLKTDIVPIILGGGHETAFAHFLGYAEVGKDVTIINIDAHTDVRPLRDGKAHSGSPFRQALEHPSGCGRHYIVAGLQPFSVTKSHLEYIESKNGTCLFKEDLTLEVFTELLDSVQNEHVMVTFDMDAVDQAFAPGVSAPCTGGLDTDLWLKMAYQAGLNKQVTSFDISEVNPEYDRDGQTGRLAARTVAEFMRGVGQR